MAYSRFVYCEETLTAVRPDGSHRAPLTPAFSPYEGEKENVSPVVEHASGLDFRGVGKRAVRGCRGSPGSAGPALENSL